MSEIQVKPEGMSDEDWKVRCAEQGLVSMTHEEYLKRTGKNRHERRRALVLARRALRG
jgi:hypothetical protein